MKVLSYGDNEFTSTGYGTMWNNLISRWAKLKPDWTFYHVGWQSRDRPHKANVSGYVIKQEDIGKPIESLPGVIRLPMGNVEYGFDTVEGYLTQYNPDYLITMADVGWQSGFVDGVKRARINGWKGKWIAYTPLDNDDWAMTWTEIFQEPDINLAMAEFGEKHMKNNNVPRIKLIKCGTDTKAYYPLLNREELKTKFRLGKQFVVGFVGRNQTRKMLDRIIIGFTNFAKDKNDVQLLLHTDLEPPQQGWSLKYMQWKYKIADKLKLTRPNLNINVRQTIQPENMNEIYNLMDVFCFGTGGEGFGIPALECQSCGVPLIMTDCTTADELCRPELRIPILKDKYGRNVEMIGTNGVHFEYPDDVEITRLLNQFYDEWKAGKLEDRRKEAREFSLKYDWDLIAPKFIELMEEQHEVT
jgi:glycosyltransferase involved in cell wall biosynthesis